MGFFSVLKSTFKLARQGLDGLNYGLEELNKGLDCVNQELEAWNDDQREKQPLKSALHLLEIFEIRLNNLAKNVPSTLPCVAYHIAITLQAIPSVKQFLEFGIEQSDYRQSVLAVVEQFPQVFEFSYDELKTLFDKFYEELQSNPIKLEVDALESLESGRFGEALACYERAIDKLNTVLPIELTKLDPQYEYINEIMNNWHTWKIKYKKQISHVAGYEEAFVDNVLSQIPDISPADVIPQFHFIDDNGGNRYIDFMIVNESKGYYLPIELDGTYKDTNHQRWKDFLVRQNSLITKFGVVLRFSNKQMVWEPSKIVEKISQTLHIQSTNKVTEESKARERERLKDWYEKKLNELEQSSHNHKTIEAEINQLRSLVEEIRTTPQQVHTKKAVTSQVVSDSKSSFWLGVSAALSAVLVGGLVLWLKSDVPDSKELKYSIAEHEIMVGSDDIYYQAKTEIDKVTSSNGNDVVKRKADDNKSIHDWVEVQVDEPVVSTQRVELHKQGFITSDQAKSLVGSYQIVCGVIKEVKAFSKGTYLNFEYPYPNTEFRAVVWDLDVDKLLRYGEHFQHFLNQRLCVSGDITSFNGQPQIIVKYRDQIERF
ncbi:TPA: hypothetical protein ACX6SH_002264 [Photobacterium damselae]